MFQKVNPTEMKKINPLQINNSNNNNNNNNSNEKEIDTINSINNYVTTNVDNKKVIKRKRGLGYFYNY